MRLRHLLLLLTAAAATPAYAAAFDPSGDFLATYARASASDLDFTSASVNFDGSAFRLALTVDGPITSTPGKLWVWGVNRGAGTPRLNALFDPDLDPTVLWDALAVLSADGTLRVVAFPLAGPPVITVFAGGATVSGNSISTVVPLALWSSRGFTPAQYTFQLWSRFRSNPAVDGDNTEVADFGPRITAVPEPASWMMLIAGFGLAGAALRVRRRTVAFAQ